MNKKIVLIGGGGHCKSVIDVAELAGYHIIGIIDATQKLGDKILGYTILGNDDVIPNYIVDCEFLVTVGQIKNSEIRRRLQKLVLQHGGKLATIVSPNAHVSKHASIGQGTVVLHQAVVNAGARIGEGCIINTFANIEHDVQVGDFCHVSTGAMVNGDCRIFDDVFIGSQAVIVNGVSVCKKTFIGAGAVVIHDILESGVYVGNPLKKSAK